MLKKKGLQSSGSSKTPHFSQTHFIFLMTEIPFLEQIVTPANPGDPVQLVPRTEKTNKNKNIFFSISLSLSLSYTLLKAKLLSETSQFPLFSKNLFFFKLKK